MWFMSGCWICSVLSFRIAMILVVWSWTLKMFIPSSTVTSTWQFMAIQSIAAVTRRKEGMGNGYMSRDSKQIRALPQQINDTFPEQGSVSAIVWRHEVPGWGWGLRSRGLDWLHGRYLASWSILERWTIDAYCSWRLSQPTVREIKYMGAGQGGHLWFPIDMISIMSIIRIKSCCPIGTLWLAAADSTGDTIPLITGGSSQGTPENWTNNLYFLICRTSSRGFCMSFMLFGLKA